ncbi:PTS system N-acetylgalactosamine-specific EIIC component 1 [Serratia fonticola]|uniref:PTS system N-acetylgalactosamine-specific EIIC component 1 n=1 Tax=Serratia fonticola TaxID=47917 RepID=A0A4U9WNP2_SERFO|nr:PTS system N-acetylgalactosamine-specific EIIC component 1 [Serratia fonticola]CAI0970242.1 PTS system N-acetylgalactosamine-specific EIIC component 1 [Serratia fonticola]CAI1503279.1 PTS system N-acetylgalactosamine-specific EIIC component 1 [Serratia fonticola]CAI1616520.1 PTS system N-acetylgalactosamine-specific EIIC component 1 [Serratia fonticola]CAI1828230.1 PTS system N-acetylgalactosamine-specific EIIC component 1 [Serratia fonticola]
MKTPFIPFFIVGFLFVTFIPVQNLLPVAVLGAAFAVYEFFNQQKKAGFQQSLRGIWKMASEINVTEAALETLPRATWEWPFIFRVIQECKSILLWIKSNLLV